jgi:uncharacterized protein
MDSSLVDTNDIWNFPCEMPIKVMGPSRDSLRPLVIEIFSRHVSLNAETRISETPSRTGKYISITVTIVIENKQQIENLFAELAHHQQHGDDISFVI